MDDKGQNRESRALKTGGEGTHFDTFVLDKGIFSNVFEKDIRRVYIYKKAERLAKAIHLVGPAFRQSPSLRDRIDSIAMGLVDAAIAPPIEAREALSRELLALSSILSIARTSNLLSTMNADLIAREAHLLLQEVASYEEPRLSFEEAPTLAALAKSSLKEGENRTPVHAPSPERKAAEPNKGQSNPKGQDKGQGEKTSTAKPERAEAIMEILRAKGPSYIKDISTVIRNVSEKTIQRELQTLVTEGKVLREGERRWTTYTLAS